MGRALIWEAPKEDGTPQRDKIMGTREDTVFPVLPVPNDSNRTDCGQIEREEIRDISTRNRAHKS